MQDKVRKNSIKISRRKPFVSYFEAKMKMENTNTQHLVLNSCYRSCYNSKVIVFIILDFSIYHEYQLTGHYAFPFFLSLCERCLVLQEETKVVSRETFMFHEFYNSQMFCDFLTLACFFAFFQRIWEANLEYYGVLLSAECGIGMVGWLLTRIKIIP